MFFLTCGCSHVFGVSIIFRKLVRVHWRAVQGKGGTVQLMTSKWRKEMQDGGRRGGGALGKEEQSAHIGSYSEIPDSFHSLCPIRSPQLMNTSQSSTTPTVRSDEKLMLWSQRADSFSSQLMFALELRWLGLDRRRSKAKSLPLGLIHTKDSPNRVNGMMLPFHSLHLGAVAMCKRSFRLLAFKFSHSSLLPCL